MKMLNTPEENAQERQKIKKMNTEETLPPTGPSVAAIIVSMPREGTWWSILVFCPMLDIP